LVGGERVKEPTMTRIGMLLADRLRTVVALAKVIAGLALILGLVRLLQLG
jgi:uncharacterized membrane protein YphA (DoxX/SURF4 family)